MTRCLPVPPLLRRLSSDEYQEKILGLNAAAVYGVDLDAARASRDAGREWLGAARRELSARLA